jgi:hypothetical protein
VNPDLGRRLIDLERSLGTRSSGAAPAMITLLAFGGEQDHAAAFANELREHFREASPYVEVLDLTGPRPLGLKPAWATPCLWLDYTPSPLELADLRPDLRPPTAPRADWNPPMPSETSANAPAAAQDATNPEPPPDAATAAESAPAPKDARVSALVDAMASRPAPQNLEPSDAIH